MAACGPIPAVPGFFKAMRHKFSIYKGLDHSVFYHLENPSFVASAKV